jgi:hypothetical protein
MEYLRKYHEKDIVQIVKTKVNVKQSSIRINLTKLYKENEPFFESLERNFETVNKNIENFLNENLQDEIIQREKLSPLNRRVIRIIYYDHPFPNPNSLYECTSKLVEIRGNHFRIMIYHYLAN